MSLESLPNELKRLILEAAPDVPTLSALVHASPDFHAVYRTSREQCFTAVSLSELESRGIDIVTPMDFAEISTIGGIPPGRHMRKALMHCQKQVRKARSVRLKIAECLALVALKRLAGWRVENESDVLRIGDIKAGEVTRDSKTMHAPEYPVSHTHPLKRKYDDPGAIDYAFAKYYFMAFRPEMLPRVKTAARLSDRAFRWDIAIFERAKIHFLQAS